MRLGDIGVGRIWRSRRSRGVWEVRMVRVRVWGGNRWDEFKF